MLMLLLQFKSDMPIFKHLSFILQRDWKLVASLMAVFFLTAAVGRLEHFAMTIPSNSNGFLIKIL